MIDYTPIMTMAERLRKRLGEDNNSPIDIFALAQEIEKLTLVYYPMGDSLSGMCVKGRKGTCTIAINSSMTIGRQRFSLAHEFFHLYFDDDMHSICAKLIGKGGKKEKMADAFAAYFLMPCAALLDKAESLAQKHDGELTFEDIIRIEQYFGVSHQAALYQLHNCGFINEEKLGELRELKGIIKKAESMGFQADLYRPLPDTKQYRTYGYYIERADLLLKKGIVSDGKYEELLLDAFREDLVYGTDEGGEVLD